MQQYLLIHKNRLMGVDLYELWDLLVDSGADKATFYGGRRGIITAFAIWCAGGAMSSSPSTAGAFPAAWCGSTTGGSGARLSILPCSGPFGGARALLWADMFCLRCSARWALMFSSGIRPRATRWPYALPGVLGSSPWACSPRGHGSRTRSRARMFSYRQSPGRIWRNEERDADL